jgi:hypothetical protein
MPLFAQVVLSGMVPGSLSFALDHFYEFSFAGIDMWLVISRPGPYSVSSRLSDVVWSEINSSDLALEIVSTTGFLMILKRFSLTAAARFTLPYTW